jgi:hypothetical protein
MVARPKIPALLCEPSRNTALRMSRGVITRQLLDADRETKALLLA